MTSERTLQVGLAAVASTLVLRMALALGTDLYIDEAYYWTWSRHLAFGYFDHPPMIAWLIAVLGTRPSALACGAATLAAVWGFARDVHGSSEAGWRAVALWSAVPGALIAGVIATPDAPLLLAWTVALWAIHRERWVAAGVLSGLALLSKYTAALLAPSFLASAIAHRRFARGAWLTSAVALVVLSPLVFWNAQHGWVSFGFQLHHGLAGVGGARSALEFVLGQLLMAGPVMLPLALVWVFRGPTDQRLLRMACAVPLALLALAAVRSRGEPNWPIMAYVSAAVGLGGTPIRGRSAAIVSGFLLSVLGVSHLVHPIVHLPNEAALERLQGWSALSVLRTEGASVVYAPTYQLASEAAYYTNLPVAVAGEERASQFDLWPAPVLPLATDALWVSEEPAPPDSLSKQFQTVVGPRLLTADFQGRRVHTFRVWELRGRLDGTPPKR